MSRFCPFSRGKCDKSVGSGAMQLFARTGEGVQNSIACYMRLPRWIMSVL